jgi:hypothetical protein
MSTIYVGPTSLMATIPTGDITVGTPSVTVHVGSAISVAGITFTITP